MNEETIKMPTEPRKPVEYVNNKEFYDALVAYIDECRANPENKPRVTNYLGDCIIKIANGMARRPNFSNYSWKDEMKGDAIETCLRYIDNFDYVNYKNPFGYFSQICWYSFIGRITQEKKQSKIKRGLIKYANVDTFTLQQHDETGEFTMNLQEFLSSLGEEEEEIKPRKGEVKPGPLEGFM